ncbi:cell division protein FtsQ/DivIB [Curtanaerobium respiraculi]|uniref:cell division protein FtsQ/DivIB n=1 Tax=Curtanaerobium respiraculi TaxID=2949669 RepID=UPI0024B36FA6|nr:FtsQ-type POTRA domain-containing protein [Curtanaerobium respiraculi]
MTMRRTPNRPVSSEYRRSDRSPRRAGSPHRAATGPSARRPPRSDAHPRITSVRVGDLDARASSPRRAVRSGGRAATASAGAWARRAAIALGVAIAGIALYGVLVLAGVFGISQVTVSGVSHLTATEISQLAAVPAGSTLLTVDGASIESRLESNPWVESASVRRIFPDTLELAITERRISAVVSITSTESQQAEKWAISSDGIWLMRIPEQGTAEASAISQKIYEDEANVLHIADAPYGVSPKEGFRCTDASVLNALNIVSQLTTELAGQVTTVSATDTSNTLLTLENGVQIAFGTGSDVREKERVCLKLMEEHPGKISYINVRVVEHPTWRAFSS